MKTIKSRDIEVLKKICEKAKDLKWNTVSPSEEEYSLIDYPVEAERRGNVYLAEVKKGLLIITGAYEARFYYEEESYTWEKKYFASIIANVKQTLSSISFITDEDYEDAIVETKLFNFPVFNPKKPNNVVVDLYDLANRKALGVDDLYSEFLNEDE